MLYHDSQLGPKCKDVCHVKKTFRRIEIGSGRNRVKLFFFGGGGVPIQTRIQDFLKGGGVKTFTNTHPPLDIVRVTSSAMRKIEKHPHYNVLL